MAEVSVQYLSVTGRQKGSVGGSSCYSDKFHLIQHQSKWSRKMKRDVCTPARPGPSSHLPRYFTETRSRHASLQPGCAGLGLGGARGPEGRPSTVSWFPPPRRAGGYGPGGLSGHPLPALQPYNREVLGVRSAEGMSQAPRF